MSRTFLGTETVASTGSSAYTLTLPSSAGTVNLAEMQPENGLAYISFDGTAPTSSAGISMSSGSVYKMDGGLHTAKIVFSSTNTSLYVNYWE